MKSKISIFFIALLLCLVMVPGDAYAYIDPGLGSTLFQFLIAGLVGLWWALKCYWANILAWLRRRKKPGKLPDKNSS